MLCFRLNNPEAISGSYWLPINQTCIERRLLLLKKILDERAPDYLSEKLFSLKVSVMIQGLGCLIALFLFHVPIA